MKIYLLFVALFFSHFSFSGGGFSIHSKLDAVNFNMEDDETDIEDDESKIEDDESKIEDDETKIEGDESKVGDGGKGFFRNIFHKNKRTNRKKVYNKMPTADKDDQEEMILYEIDPEGVPRLMPRVGASIPLFQKAACQRIEVNNEKKPFNEDGLVYTPEQINDIHLSDVFNSHLEDFTKYANQRTYAFPDVCQELRVAAIEKGESRLTKIDEITVIDLANLAYVSLFAKKEENKTSALDRFNKLKDQYQNRT